MKRELFTKIIQRIDEKEAIIVTGMRRVGKTTLLKQVYDQLESSNKLFLDLENPLNQKYFEKTNYEEILYQFSLLGIDTKKHAYIFLDEIQYTKNIPSVVKYLMDHYDIKFLLTGSASFYLKNLFSESLAGRKIIYELFPVSFSEFLALKGSSLRIPQDTITETVYQTLIPLYKEYLEFGGFPAVVTKPSFEQKNESLDDIFSSYFNKEVLGIGGFRNNKTMRDLILLLAERVGSKIDVSKLSVELHVSRVTIEEYLAFLEGTYFISLISPYSTNRNVEIRSAKKIYFCDSGLLQHIAKLPFGNIFENAIYNQLKTQGDVQYYQRKSGAEVDFIINGEVGWEVKTKAGKLDATNLERLVSDLGLRQQKLVSYDWIGQIPVLFGFQV